MTTETLNPYSAPDATLVDERPAQTEQVLAGRLIRLGAQLLDALIFGSIGIVAAIVIPNVAGAVRGAGPLIALGLLMVAWFVVALVVQLRLLHKYGQTLGKRLVKIRIVRTSGDRVSLGRIIGLRYLVLAVLGMIPFLGIVVSLLDPLMIFRADRRCLHDLIADTKVIEVGETLS